MRARSTLAFAIAPGLDRAVDFGEAAQARRLRVVAGLEPEPPARIGLADVYEALEAFGLADRVERVEEVAERRCGELRHAVPVGVETRREHREIAHRAGHPQPLGQGRWRDRRRAPSCPGWEGQLSGGVVPLPRSWQSAAKRVSTLSSRRIACSITRRVCSPESISGWCSGRLRHPEQRVELGQDHREGAGVAQRLDEGPRGERAQRALELLPDPVRERGGRPRRRRPCAASARASPRRR